jgi:hypothetical protein
MQSCFLVPGRQQRQQLLRVIFQFLSCEHGLPGIPGKPGKFSLRLSQHANTNIHPGQFRHPHNLTRAIRQLVARFRQLPAGFIYRDRNPAGIVVQYIREQYLKPAGWRQRCRRAPFLEHEVVDRFVVGQLFAKMPDWDEDEEVEFPVALDRLIEAERDIVVETLREGFGGTAGLYASVWHSRDDMEEAEEESDEDDCFEPDDGGKQEAYEWIAEGCPRRADPAE